MRIIKPHFILLIFLLHSTFFLKAQSDLVVDWVPRGPKNSNNYISNFILDKGDPSKPFSAWASGYGGLWYNSDITNSSWEIVNPAFGSTSIIQHPINTNTIYATNEGGGNYVTYDRGENWTILDSLNNISGTLVINDNGDLFLYHPRRGKQIWRYDNALKRFVWALNMDTDFPYESDKLVSNIDFDHNNHLYFSLTNGKLFKSSNTYGGGWSEISPVSQSNFNRGYTGLHIQKRVGYSVLFTIHKDYQNVWFMKSIDGGVTWTNLNLTGESSNILADQTLVNITFKTNDINTIILSHYKGIAISSDLGGSWFYRPVNSSYIPNSLFTSDGSLVLHELAALSLIENPLLSSNIRKIEQGLLLNIVRDYSISPIHNDSIVEIEGSLFIGNDTLDILETNFPISNNHGIVFDEDEINSSLLLYDYFDRDNLRTRDSIVFINRTGDIQKKTLSAISNFSNLRFEERSNTIYDVYSDFQNKRYVRRLRNLRFDNPKVDTFTIDDLHPFQRKLIPISDSSLVFCCGNNGRLLTKHTIHFDKTVQTDTLKEFTDNYKFFFHVSKHDPNFQVAYSPLIYSLNGGKTWSPDTQQPSNVNSMDFNERNPNHLFFCSNNDIFFSDNFLSTHPTWYNITGNIPNQKSNLSFGKIKFRESDGKLFISNLGNGIYSTDYFSYLVQDSIWVNPNHISKVNNNQELNVRFYRTGNSESSNGYDLILSDSTGNFKTESILIGSANQSPILGCIPQGIKASNNYYLSVVSKSANIEGKSSKIEVNKFDYNVKASDNSVLNKGIINSSIKLDDLPKVNYFGLNSIILKPGFKASSGSLLSFTAEIHGCENAQK